MNKIWVVVLLFCSTSLSATEKTRLDLEWRAEPQNEKTNFTLKWREEEKVEKPVNEMAGTPPYPLHHNPYAMHNSYGFGNVHRSNRQGFIDPIFSSSTSDGGYVRQRY